MAAIHQLIDQIEDERLRARLREEADALTQGRSFGLVFERHLPEVTPIYRARPCRGDAVAVRGELLEDLWRVQRIQQGQAICQHLTLRIPTNVTACTDEGDRQRVRASVGFRF